MKIVLIFLTILFLLGCQGNNTTTASGEDSTTDITEEKTENPEEYVFAEEYFPPAPPEIELF